MRKSSFTPEFKTRLVLEVLREERTINEIASANDISHTLLRTWKKEFLDNVGSVFDNSKQEKKILNLEKERIENENNMLQTIGQLKMELDYMKKKSIAVFGYDYEKKFTR